MPDDDRIQRLPISKLRQEEGAHELATSQDMEPYIEFAKAVITNADTTAELEVIRQLPPGTALRLASGVGAEVGVCGFR